ADALERAITGPAGEPDSWGDGVRAAAAEVRAALDAHVVEVESPGGLYVEITDRSPRLAHAIEVLRREHGTMGQQLDELDAVLDSRAPDVEKVREDALVLLMEISRHRHKGAD